MYETKQQVLFSCLKVFEVNSASKRSGKHILSQLEEATQSHLVISNKPTTTIKGPVPESSFAGLFSKPEANPSCASGPLGALFQKAGKASKSEEKKGVKGRKGKSVKEKKEKSRAKGKSILKQPSQSLSQDGTESNLSSKAASLILFEEVSSLTKLTYLLGMIPRLKQWNNGQSGVPSGSSVQNLEISQSGS